MFSPASVFFGIKADAQEPGYAERTLREAAHIIEHSDEGVAGMLAVLGSHDVIADALVEFHSDKRTLDVELAYTNYDASQRIERRIEELFEAMDPALRPYFEMTDPLLAGVH